MMTLHIENKNKREIKYWIIVNSIAILMHILSYSADALLIKSHMTVYFRTGLILVSVYQIIFILIFHKILFFNLLLFSASISGAMGMFDSMAGGADHLYFMGVLESLIPISIFFDLKKSFIFINIWFSAILYLLLINLSLPDAVSTQSITIGLPFFFVLFTFASFEYQNTRKRISQQLDDITSITETMSDAFFSCDNELKIKYINSKAKNILNFSPDKIALEDYNIEQEQNLKELASNPQESSFIKYFKDTSKYYDINVVSSNNMISFFLHDVTDIEFAKQKLEKAVTEKNLTIHKVIHEVRSPLQTISFNTNFIDKTIAKNTEMDSSVLSKYNERIKQSFLKIDKFINEIDFDNRRIIPSSSINTENNPYILFDHFIETIFEYIRNNNTSYSYNTIPVDVKIAMDENKLFQIFINLVNNAIKYSIDKNILFNFSVKENRFHVSIANKTDLSINDIDLLFNEFYRKSNIQDLSGNGLGLSIVKDIIMSSGGHIYAELKDNFIFFYLQFPVFQI